MTSFTPTFTGITLGNAVVSGAYGTLGDLVYLEFRIQWGSTTSVGGNWRLNNLPVNAQVTTSQATGGTADPFQNYMGFGAAYDNSSTLTYQIGFDLNDTTTINHKTFAADGTYVTPGGNTSSTIPFTWATSDVLAGRMWYRKA